MKGAGKGQYQVGRKEARLIYTSGKGKLKTRSLFIFCDGCLCESRYRRKVCLELQQHAYPLCYCEERGLEISLGEVVDLDNM